ncbi:MAG: RAD55 family ATPase [Halobacteriales archaeon]
MEEVQDGSNLLVEGSSAEAKERLCHAVLREGADNGEPSIYVTTKYTAEEVLERFDVSDPFEQRFGVVECTSHGSAGDDGEMVKHVGSPGDVTGIGIKVSDLIDLYTEQGIEGGRVCLNSVSTLLMYSDLETVFRFLHVFTGRVRSIGGLGVYVVEPDMHDPREYSTLVQLFDGTIEVRGEGELEARVTGVGRDVDWVEIDV